MPISTYADTAAGNNVSGGLFPENQLPSTVNDGLRQMQADVRNWYASADFTDLGFTPTYASATTFTVAGDKTSTFLVNRAIKCTDATTLYGVIAASSYTSPNTTVTVSLDSGSLSASLTAVAVSIIQTSKPLPANLTLRGTTAFTNITAAIITASSYLSSPILRNLSYLKDGNDKNLISFTPTTSAVNNFNVLNAATGSNPVLSTEGTDTNIAFVLQAKGTGVYAFLASSTAPSTLRVYEQTTNGTNRIDIKAPTSLSADWDFTLPTDNGSPKQHLQTDGNGVTSWEYDAVLQSVSTSTSTVIPCSTPLPSDNTKPQSGEGNEVFTLTIDPYSSLSQIEFTITLCYGATAAGQATCAVFEDSGVDAIAAFPMSVDVADSFTTSTFTFKVPSTSGTARTYKVRVGMPSGTVYINSRNGSAFFGGLMKSTLTIREIIE